MLLHLVACSSNEVEHIITVLLCDAEAWQLQDPSCWGWNSMETERKARCFWGEQGIHSSVFLPQHLGWSSSYWPRPFVIFNFYRVPFFPFQLFYSQIMALLVKHAASSSLLKTITPWRWSLIQCSVSLKLFPTTQPFHFTKISIKAALRWNRLIPAGAWECAASPFLKTVTECWQGPVAQQEIGNNMFPELLSNSNGSESAVQKNPSWD